MEQPSIKLDLLVETSWEVCNKVGGIYTVLSTKAKTLQSFYKGNLIFIGPDVWTEENPSPYFVESQSLLKSWKQSLQLPDGISVRVGRWDIPGRPLTILVKYNGVYASKDEIYSKIWDLYGVDSLHAYGDYDESCMFSVAAAKVIESLVGHLCNENSRVIAHFDEWTTGMGLLYLKWRKPSVATIFTTHATCMGRSICGNNKPLYDYLKGYNGDQMSWELNMQSKHSLEKAAAHQADCFTTVSDITAIECEQLLERKPDVVTPNGFERNFVPTGVKYNSARSDARQMLLKVARSLTGRELPNDTFIIGTSGRCEYRNKGLDVFLDSMATLASENVDRTILAYIMVPAWVKSPRTDLSNALANDCCQSLPTPYMTHWINNPGGDPIERRLGEIKQPDNVTIIYVPCYLDGVDGIFNRSYYDLLIGMDATVFPSYYEPWGYTPLESVAFGIPTVTTSLSGFGQWVKSSFDDEFDQCGVNVVNRSDSNYSAVVLEICNSIKSLVKCGKRDAEAISKAAMRTAKCAAWTNFIAYYERSFETALLHGQQRQN